jgi:hypothetical protein
VVYRDGDGNEWCGPPPILYGRQGIVRVGGPPKYGRTGYQDGRDGEVLRERHCENREPTLELKDLSDM